MINRAYNSIKDFDDEKAKRAYMLKVCEIMAANANSTSVFLNYRFDLEYEEFFGQKFNKFIQINKDFNNFVLSLEDKLKKEIYASQDPLETAIIYSRKGNYIDFAAMPNVTPEEFLKFFDTTESLDKKNYERFKADLARYKSFLLICDNCGEIVLDKILIEVILEYYPYIEPTVMVKGSNVLNDAVRADAIQCGIDKIARVITTGNRIAGCDLMYISDTSLPELKKADIILAKGQANFETLYKAGFNTYYAFLCKCEYFAKKFNVKQLAGMFIKDDEGTFDY